MLHIIKTLTGLHDAVALCHEQDALLLIEDAVYAANPQHQSFPMVKGQAAFVLDSDLLARGISHRVSPSCTVVDYAGFVELTEQHRNSLTWN
ncbi:sulfurtransferase complex subunit TusB [Vibrio sp. CAU 1672]|uniref:sulfurtransferase complex subunit TusB n=1 Tax=Vibrio sp. CAU 1672 TaxID=3032594 RepID=UPI0023DA3467|nr:sulfurtransferase complex subunit TusB [Vibrio sp. CAU 1672]MDF2154681.1 sulfurtransferase complex subunit TusB [Vibrio sp. CAU 1672]